MSLQDLIQEMQTYYKDLPVGYCFLDTDLRFIHINSWLAELNGIPAEDHLGRTLGELVPDVAAGVEPQYRQVIDTGEPIVGGMVEAETPARPGIKRYFQHSYFPVKSDDNEIIGISCVVEDVTVRNEACAALQRANDEPGRSVLDRAASKLSQRAMAEILEQLTQFSYGRGTSQGLRSAQWAALRYFHQAEDEVRTVGRLARYNLVTASSASQTIDTLVNRGLLKRARMDGDQRSYRVDLTPAGQQLLAEDPINLLVESLSTLPAKDQVQFAKSLETLFHNLLLRVAASRGFGQSGKNSR